MTNHGYRRYPFPNLRTPERILPDATPELSVVIPLHNEEESLPELERRLVETLNACGATWELVIVNDGSRDATGALLDAWRLRTPSLAVIHLSRNFGHQAAVTAGLDHASGNAVIVMDGDLQDPPELIPALLAAWRNGAEVVYAQRRTRAESLPLRWAYAGFYRILSRVSEIPIPLDAGDFCLMDRLVLDAMNQLPERARFLRGLRCFVGFKHQALPYDRPARAAGYSKYSLRALVRLALDGLVSFSAAPLRWVTFLGLIIAAGALALLGWVLVDAVWHHTAPQGWASTIAVILFMGAVQLISLGVLGEYVRLIFVETKGRPTYIAALVRPVRSFGNLLPDDVNEPENGAETVPLPQRTNSKLSSSSSSTSRSSSSSRRRRQ